MKLFKYIFIFVCFSTFAQTSLSSEFIQKEPLKVDALVSIDNFGSMYVLRGSEFALRKRIGEINYSNVQLGAITSASAFNPLKINLFYKDFNSVIVLDNRLAEIIKIDFNTLPEFRLVTHVSTGNDNTIWLYNQNTQQLELFDYLLRKTRITTLPIDDPILDLKSNYNNCWVLTESYLLVYNYIGSLVKKIPNDGFTKIEEDNENVFLLKGNNLYFLSENSTEFLPLKSTELLINQFLVTNETLYIYADEMLHQFQLKMN